MTVVALVRHGETDWNREGRLQGSSDIPLNSLGRRQAVRAGVELAALPYIWSTLVSSPLSRAHATATAIGGQIGLTVTATYDDLVERSFGEAEGTREYQRWQRWPGGLFPGMEPHHDVARRMSGRVEQLADEHVGEAVIAVSHGGAIRAVLGPLLGGPPPRIRNGGISILERTADTWNVLAINSTPPEDIWW